jgi:hypothetical protein
MKRIYMTLALIGAMVTGASAQNQDMEAVLFMDDGTNLIPTHYLTPDTTPSGDSAFGAWGVFNNGPDDLLLNDKISVISSFNRWVNEDDPDWNDTAKYFYYSIPTMSSDKIAPSYIYGPFSYDSIGRIGLLYDWDIWDTQDSVVMLGPPYEQFVNGQEYGMFVRVWGLGDDPAAPSNTDEDLTNNRKVVRVIWNGSGTSIKEMIAPKDKVALTVYPNPADDRLSFNYKFEKNTHAEIIVRDISGRKVLSQDLGRVMAGDQKMGIDVSSLTTGIYTVEMSTGTISAIAKFNKK